MRPVKKWLHTDDTIIPPVKEFYNPYQDAKDDLERNIDGYCSYCERPSTDDAAHVEHIQPKGLAQYHHLEYSWMNFLMACARCNGADNKGNKDVVFSSIHLPNLNNTLMSIAYGEGGFVKANANLQNQELANAQALVDLVGLDKRPGHAGHKRKDKRWDRRREVWELAKRKLASYNDGRIDPQTILELAKGYGFWSVWFNMFIHIPPVKLILIQEFRGTDPLCFDTDHNPVPRNPTNHPDTV